MIKNNFHIDFSILNSLEDMCFFLDKDGCILQMNISASLKFNSKTASGKVKNCKNIFDLILPEQKENVISAFNSCIKKLEIEKIESTFEIGKDRLETVLNFLPNLNDAFEKKENNFECLLIARDITSDKSKEADFLRFYRIAENTVNPLEITDKDGNLIYVNPAFVGVSGYSREELIGQNPRIFGSGKNSKKFWSKMWETIKSGKVWVGEIENTKKNGEPFFTQLLISPIIDKKGNVTGYFGIHRDLSEKRLLEKQLIHTQKMESIGTLAAGIAHEVGNPLASISALVQVAQRSTDDSFISEKLSLVKSQVTRISKIIRDLVDFSRPSNYELQLTDINKNITEAVEITKVGTKAKDIEFSMVLTENIPSLPLISDQVQQVFVNILLNAVDAIMENETVAKNKIEVKSELRDSNIVITFKDTGKGIPEENYSKVFEPFFTTKKQGKGTGLGLWVSYGIIKSFQGDIKVSSKLNSGTTFTITLPVNPNN